MLKQEMNRTLNEQVQNELFSSYLYLSMSAYFSSLSLNGMSHWMRIQSMEELTHAMKIYDYIVETGGEVELLELNKPKFKWESPLQVFEEAYAHEQFITDCINKLSSQAVELKDHATQIFLHWFVTEQIEEEANASEIVAKLKLIKDSPQGLFMMDSELGARMFVTPIPAMI